MTQNPVSGKCAKHIDLNYHFVRELVASGKLYTKFVPTKLQADDILTKSLPHAQFVFIMYLSTPLSYEYILNGHKYNTTHRS